MNNTNRTGMPPVLPSMPALDAGMEAALAHKPEPPIPAAFAARVAAAAVAQPARRGLPARSAGWITAWASLIVAALALFILAPHTTVSVTNYRFDAEILLLAQAAAIAWGISRGYGARFTR